MRGLEGHRFWLATLHMQVCILSWTRAAGLLLCGWLRAPLLLMPQQLLLGRLASVFQCWCRGWLFLLLLPSPLIHHHHANISPLHPLISPLHPLISILHPLISLP